MKIARARETIALGVRERPNAVPCAAEAVMAWLAAQPLDHDLNPQVLMAAASLALVPILIIYMLGQKYFVRGITLTGMGGR